jgi:hypothetical protein
VRAGLRTEVVDALRSRPDLEGERRLYATLVRRLRAAGLPDSPLERQSLDYATDEEKRAIRRLLRELDDAIREAGLNPAAPAPIGE